MIEQEQLPELLHRPYNLTLARQFPAKKTPATHQSEALSKLMAWFSSKPAPAGAMLVLPTGGGKTFTAIRFLCAAPLSQGYKVLWLAHTHHLLVQAFDSFGPEDPEEGRQQGWEVGHIKEPRSGLSVRVVSGTPGHYRASDIKSTDDVVIGTLQTIARAFSDPFQSGLKAFLDSAPDRLLVVFDEAHHSPAPSYRRLLTGLREAYPAIMFLGLTATPTYTDVKKQGWLKKLFPQGIVYQVSPYRLMATRILAQPVLEEPATNFTPEFDQRLYQNWVGTYRDLPDEVINSLARSSERNAMIVETYLANQERYGKTIMFADRWYQCEQLAEMLLKRGVRAGTVYSHVDADPGSVEARNKKDKSENARVLHAFKAGQLDVLINVRMLTEGTDVPQAQTVFLTRQTTSRILLTQMVGRALRGPGFGGTEKAYIVAFFDNWKQSINWAGYDQLSEGLADEAVPEYGKRPPLQLISIELVRQVARQMDTGLNIVPVPFLRMVPVGWYRVEYDAAIEGSDDTESVRQLVMVYDNEAEGYSRLIEELLLEELGELEGERLEHGVCQTRLEKWQDRYFSSSQVAGQARLEALLQIARHVAQNNTAPAFFAFNERDNHDLDRLAAKFSFQDNLGAVALKQALLAEYHREDRFWRSIYYNYTLFKCQYDACVNRLLDLPDGQTPENGLPFGASDPRQGEPSEELKRQVKLRDSYRCLCCGESNRRSLQIDHVAPSYYGGNNSLDNLQTLCRTCNRDKGVSELNFRLHSSPLNSAPASFRKFETPDDPGSDTEWKIFLRRSINFFYGCSAVADIKIGKRGYYFYNWAITLYPGNNSQWLKTHLSTLREVINQSRFEGGYYYKIDTILLDGAPEAYQSGK